MTSYHLAELNIAHLVAPLDDPALADFVAGLDEINRLADHSPGFVWRYTDEDEDNALGSRPLGPDVIVNLSVWESLEALRVYTFQSGHLDYLRRRREWFRHGTLPASFVAWWVPAGTRPTLEEGIERLERLVAEGPSPAAFTFRTTYPAPTGAAPRAPLPAHPA